MEAFIPSNREAESLDVNRQPGSIPLIGDVIPLSPGDIGPQDDFADEEMDVSLELPFAQPLSLNVGGSASGSHNVERMNVEEPPPTTSLDADSFPLGQPISSQSNSGPWPTAQVSPWPHAEDAQTGIGAWRVESSLNSTGASNSSLSLNMDSSRSNDSRIRPTPKPRGSSAIAVSRPVGVVKPWVVDQEQQAIAAPPLPPANPPIGKGFS